LGWPLSRTDSPRLLQVGLSQKRREITNSPERQPDGSAVPRSSLLEALFSYNGEAMNVDPGRKPANPMVLAESRARQAGGDGTLAGHGGNAANAAGQALMNAASMGRFAWRLL